MGQKVIQLIIALIVFIPVFVVFREKICLEANSLQLIALPFAVGFALILNYLINLLISFLVFWFTEVNSFFFVKDLVLDFLSGRAFPLDLMSKGLLDLFSVLPFAYCTYFPIKLLISTLTMQSLLMGLAMQVIWGIIMYSAIKLVWQCGIKRYAGTGM